MDYNKKDIEQSAWNLSQHIINEIGFSLQRASRNFRSGNIQTAFWDVEEIRLLIHADLDSEESKKLDEMGLSISKLYSSCERLQNIQEAGTITQQQMKELQISKSNHYNEVKRYRMFIMELLSKYGYSVSKKESSSRMF